MTQNDNQLDALRQLFANSPLGMAVFHVPDITLVEANQVFLNFLDAPYNQREKSIGKHISEIITGWKDSESERIWERVLANGKAYHIPEYQFDGFLRGTTYWDASLTPIYQEGRLTYFVEITTDITQQVLDRKKIEAQGAIITGQKEQLEAIIENMSDGVMLIHEDGDIKLLNEAAREIFYSPDIVKRHADTIRYAQYYDREENEISQENLPGYRILRGERIRQYRMKAERPDKTIYFNISGSPIYNEKGEIVMGVLCIRDMTEVVQYEEHIKEQRDYLYRLFDNLDIPIFSLSFPELKVMEYNIEGFKWLMDLTCSEKSVELSMGKGSELILFEFLNREDIRGYLWEMERTKGSVVQNEFKVVRNGDAHYINLIYHPIMNIYGGIDEVLVMAVDVTRERLEKDHLQKVMRIKDDFFSFMSHEIRTPLTVINSAVQAMELLCSSELSATGKKFMSKVKQNSLRLLRLVNNLLDITRADDGRLNINKCNLDIVLLSRVITQSVELYAQDKGVVLSFQTDLPSKIIGIDDEKYERILLNLLSNAIKFTPPGKRVTVSVGAVEDKVILKVQDEGVGIPEEKQRYIFARYEQTNNRLTRRAEGTGLGLTLVKLLVEALGGKITLESREGEGSTFMVRLPMDIAVSEDNEEMSEDFLKSQLVQITTVEFSDIYLEENSELE